MTGKIILNVNIPGEPHSLERHRWGKHANYDPSARDKKVLRWEIKAAAPNLKPSAARLAVKLVFHSTHAPYTEKKTGRQKYRKDASNMLKFFEDACNGLVWFDDEQIDKLEVEVIRQATEPATEITVWEL